jgi:hypothetical protein
VHHTRPHARGGDDRGQATPLAAAILGLAVLATLAFGPLGRAVTDRTQARTAADAAALAGAAEGEGAARTLAEANGGRLVEYAREGPEVEVEVVVGDVTAWARAEGRAVGPPGGAVAARGVGERAGLAPAMLAALARADALLGHPVPVASGRRTRAEQQALWDRRATNPYPVARPGSSDHETGLAVDVPRGAVPEVLRVAAEAGLCQPLPASDPVHFVVCGT